MMGWQQYGDADGVVSMLLRLLGMNIMELSYVAAVICPVHKKAGSRLSAWMARCCWQVQRGECGHHATRRSSQKQMGADGCFGVKQISRVPPESRGRSKYLTQRSLQ